MLPRVLRKGSASNMVSYKNELLHRQIAGKSCQTICTAPEPKGLSGCTTGKLVGMVRIK
jgi:hypothetical protein